jgi:hypothetical protein
MGLGVFVIANDFTALSVAIPEIESDLDAGLSQAQFATCGPARSIPSPLRPRLPTPASWPSAIPG